MHANGFKLADNLYLKLHSDLFDLLVRRTHLFASAPNHIGHSTKPYLPYLQSYKQDGGDDDDAGEPFRQHKDRLIQQIQQEVTQLEEQAQALAPAGISSKQLPPELRNCFTDKDLHKNEQQQQPEEEEEEENNVALLDKAHSTDDDEMLEDYEEPAPKKDRLNALLNVDGYGLSFGKRPKPKPKRKPSQKTGSSMTFSEKTVSQEEVLRHSEQIRKRFEPRWDSLGFPKSYKATEVYLPRTIYELHSIKYQAKPRIRHDKDTLSGLIVSLRTDPPPWAFRTTLKSSEPGKPCTM
eukprot:Protomagalhaensia_sp_Gyna_25__1344@NODE_1676_length_1633_cov_33_675031_g1372_i0_p1_GENE_NODE_1676_length_1633_cov_33_675031_g1372_i0NODE_1676_length_1633_cov_33_675031_g1372_i0_p1_ORF_typecomplete_len294_score40_18DUF2397/PF09660_10/0_0043Cas_Csy1/PF09611_10/0_01Santigen/PF05756_11/6_9e03Santigen/PF05756_11/1_6_NODE_1676_length_1633_cov_33_675031_g1372_i06961577